MNYYNEEAKTKGKVSYVFGYMNRAIARRPTEGGADLSVIKGVYSNPI